MEKQTVRPSFYASVWRYANVIIAQDSGRLRLTLQTDHARLAGQLAQCWGGPPFLPPAPLEAIRLAVDLHDEGWAEVDNHPRVNPATGRPYDFREIPQNLHVEAYERCVNRALAAHPYAGLLVCLHGTGLYRRRYGHFPHLPFREVAPDCQAQVERHLAAQDRLATRLLDECKPDPAALWTHYRWLQVWDMISVFAAMAGPTQPGTHLLGVLPHYPGGPEQPLTMHSEGENRFVIDPWPFSQEQIPLGWPARWIDDRHYTGEDHLQAVLAEAPTEMQTAILIHKDE